VSKTVKTLAVVEIIENALRRWRARVQSVNISHSRVEPLRLSLEIDVVQPDEYLLDGGPRVPKEEFIERLERAAKLHRQVGEELDETAATMGVSEREPLNVKLLDETAAELEKLK
jgi:hypothetical protein